ncbi:hypothetical protein LSCM1_01178 [Leishmania martiniquensis]|uniref:Polyadenylate-binding protein n=1 Tax=Leishmania martiniquensis TaxID=1580590 RepID=A0A836KDN6_9TRYP|nr:hypothetical protein LSCM1_01178 [Leishmania martiniquensis]
MAFSGPNPSIWVGGLDPDLQEQKLYDYFVRIGPVTSVRVCVDSATQKSLGYGYVNFQDPADAEKALDQAGTKLGSRYLRIAKIQRDPSKRRSGISNILVKKLPKSVDTYALKEMFSKFGRLTAIGLACDEKGESRGYARISFEREESAVDAVKEMDGMEMDGQAIVVERYQPQHRDELLKQYTNLYVKNLDPAVTDEKLRAFFARYGKVSSAKVRDLGGVQSEVGLGYVAFEKHDDAARAVEELNGKECEISKAGSSLDVSRFRSREERQRDRERQRRERAQQHSKYPNLYVKGFDDTVTSERLEELFQRYGETVSVTVMMDKETGMSRCFGFVSMKDQNAASQAIQELNGSTFLSPRPLFVTYALRKDARRQNLEERSKQFRVRQNPMGGPGLGGMPPMGFMGPQMFNNVNMPLMNPRVPIMPMNGMNGLGGMNGMGGMNSMGAMGPMGPMGGMNSMGAMGPMGPMGGMARPMAPNAMSQMRSRPMPQKPPMQSLMPQQHPQAPPQGQNLAAVLANLNPEQQKNVLGERLYSYIVRSHPSVAAKITGMLLEMDNSEILNMLDSPSMLDSKIAEAQDVLNRHMSV